jgi:glycosyltransferase involved in cell wall biosynthesis
MTQLSIGLLGTRGVPARYGGFETAVEEIGARLVRSGHRVTVYCRGGDRRLESYRGMKLVHLPTVRAKALETLVHTALSTIFAKHDVAVVFNAANAPLIPMLHRRGTRVALHVDGLEWRRGKWGRLGRLYYLAAERIAVSVADEIISDSLGIADYYQMRYGARSTYIAYGATTSRPESLEAVTELGLVPYSYHLVVARFEPENNVDVIIDGYVRSGAECPLVVVGSAPYSGAYTRRISTLSQSNPAVQLLGPVWDQETLNQLYAGAASYVHGHSVGGTNPSLLRAMGLGTPVLAFDVCFNREVAGDSASYFSNADELAVQLKSLEVDRDSAMRAGQMARGIVQSRYRWDDVAARYEDLCSGLAAEAGSESSEPRPANAAR